ncbi:hypothetical protein QQP08_024024 [Theobroma cacao]|nr:hypothetical protein QQP08_024024 [Theobroma cacao]
MGSGTISVELGGDEKEVSKCINCEGVGSLSCTTCQGSGIQPRFSLSSSFFLYNPSFSAFPPWVTVCIVGSDIIDSFMLHRPLPPPLLPPHLTPTQPNPSIYHQDLRA